MSHTTTRRGHLKIYLGYAAGVGKTYQVLEDAAELKSRGSDVVLGPNVLSHLSFTWCQNPCLPRFPMHLIE